MHFVCSRQVNSMKVNSLLFNATPILLATRLLVAVLFISASMLQLRGQNVVLSGAIAGRITDPGGGRWCREPPSLCGILPPDCNNPRFQITQESTGSWL
jgi:hypothetical protein